MRNCEGNNKKTEGAIENKPEEKSVDVKGKERKRVSRPRGKTGLKLPVINMGVMNSDNPNLIRAALDSGVLLLDTAHAYMQGRNEEVIGGIVKGRPRDSYFIASKVSLPQDRTAGRYTEAATEGEFLKKLDLSLKRLGIDHVDILYHHGVSRRESAFYAPGLNAVAKASRGGFRQTPSVKNPAAALKWVLQDPNVHTIVPGFTTFDQMDVDLAVMEDVGLSDSEKKDLLQEASLPGLYCQGCRECLGQCVARLPIPDLMRAYMYVYDYRNLGMAQDLVVSLALPSRVCEDCSSCPVNCAVGFSVREKIRDIARLREIPSEFIA